MAGVLGGEGQEKKTQSKTSATVAMFGFYIIIEERKLQLKRTDNISGVGKLVSLLSI